MGIPQVHRLLSKVHLWILECQSGPLLTYLKGTSHMGKVKCGGKKTELVDLARLAVQALKSKLMEALIIRFGDFSLFTAYMVLLSQ